MKNRYVVRSDQCPYCGVTTTHNLKIGKNVVGCVKSIAYCDKEDGCDKLYLVTVNLVTDVKGLKLKWQKT